MDFLTCLHKCIWQSGGKGGFPGQA